MEEINSKPIGDYENGEDLFWKVINNKVLLNLIIEKIQRTEWEIYHNYRQVGVENRLKFEYISSFYWLIVNRQYSLLKNKIENNDFILFNKKSIEVLFKYFSILNGTFLDEKAKIQKQDEKEASILKSLILLLLEKRREEFEVCDLTKAAVISNCKEAINILISEPYSFMVYPSTIQLALEKCDSEMVSLLLLNHDTKKNIILNDETKKKSLNLAISNKKYALTVVQLLLDNPNLYILPTKTTTTTTTTTPTTTTTGSFKYEIGLLKVDGDYNDDDDDTTTTTTPPPPPPPPIGSFEYEIGFQYKVDGDYDDDDDDDRHSNNFLHLEDKYSNNFIEYRNFIELGNYQIMKRLLDLNVVKKNHSNETFKITDSIDELLLKMEINFKCCHGFYIETPKAIQNSIEEIIKNQNTSQEKKLKLLQRLIVIVSREIQFNKSYILKYGESINEFHNDGFYSLNDEEYENCSSNDINESKLITLCRYLALELHFFAAQYEIIAIIQRAMNAFRENNIEWYEPFFKLIDPISRTITIKDKSNFDWIFKSTKCELFKEFIFSRKFVFETFESSIYLYENKENIPLNMCHLFTHEFFFIKPYFKAIKECDIERLKKIDSIIGASSFSKQPLQQQNKDLYDLPSSKEDVLKLINYFSETGFKVFTKQDLTSFFSNVFKTIEPSEIIIVFPSNTLNVNDFLLSAMFDLDFKLLELLVNSLDDIRFTVDDFETVKNFQRQLFTKKLHIIHNDKQLIEFDSLYRLIEVMIKKYSKTKKLNVVKLSRSVEVIVNYLFQMLIQREYITSKEVTKLYQLLQHHSVPIYHSLFNSFFYLLIRSSKFTKYIMSRPGITVFFELNYEQSYNCSIEDYEGLNEINQKGFNLANYLQPDIFTFEYVLGVNSETGEYNTKFDQVLLQLVHQLSHSIIYEVDIVNEFLFQSLNADLKYFLDIRRVDLFFLQLDFINKQIELTNEENYVCQEENQLFPLQEFIYNSPANTLLPTSDLLLNREQPPPPSSLLSNEESSTEGLKFSLPCINTFNFSNSVLDLSCMVMNIDEIQRFIEWNWYRSSFQTTIFSRSLFWSRFDITEHLLKNYDIPFFSLPHLGFDNNYAYILEFKYIVENHFDKVKNQTLFLANQLKFDNLTFSVFLVNDIVEYVLRCQDNEYNQFINIETRENFLDNLICILYDNHNNKIALDEENYSPERETLLASIMDSEETKLMIENAYNRFKVANDEKSKTLLEKRTQEYQEQNDNIFICAFAKGDITMCELLLKYYPKQHKITNYAITESIRRNNIHIIKYYYHKNNQNLIINLRDDKSLLEHLKNELSYHEDYKFDTNFNFN
ncbi:hypothetical protein RB653_002947 [Dictyostelium firmibasis]|uniref:Uncharacterized protein n=1 Tax=Dictyostelium firmibasis TaxID=79012 RepID=A0AAN7UAU0_9MYCE